MRQTGTQLSDDRASDAGSLQVFLHHKESDEPALRIRIMVDEIHHRHKPLVDVKIAQIILILFLTGLALRHGLHIGFDLFRRHKRRTMLIKLRIFLTKRKNGRNIVTEQPSHRKGT